jgi:hypothetical protein
VVDLAVGSHVRVAAIPVLNVPVKILLAAAWMPVRSPLIPRVVQIAAFRPARWVI